MTEATERRLVRRAVLGLVLTAAVLFGAAGSWRWWNGWVFLAAFAATTLPLPRTVFRRTPDLYEERRQAAKQAKAWDRAIVPAVSGLPVAALVLAAVDRRFGWTHVATGISLVALAALLGGAALTLWAISRNRFFSSHVRIQTDRGHTVINGGPYAYVRHPGYVGAIVVGLASPVVLGSWAAFWVGASAVPLWILRTALEDRTLRDELAGYREYATSVRYRLLPLVW